MRIGSQSGISSKNVGQTGKSNGATRTSGSSFKELVESTATPGGAIENCSHQMLGELKELAKDVVSGKSSKEEASRLFVNLIIKDRFGENLQSKKAKTVQKAVADIVEQDPHFVSRLDTQLKKIAATA